MAKVDKQTFLGYGLNLYKEAVSHCKIVSSYSNVETFQLQNILNESNVAFPRLNNIMILYVSGFDEVYNNIYVVTSTEENPVNHSLSSDLDAISSEKIRKSVKWVNTRGLEDVPDGQYVIVCLNEDKKTIDSNNLKSKANVELRSTTVSVTDETFSEKKNNIIKIVNICDTIGIKDGVYIFIAMSSKQNVPEESIILDLKHEHPRLQFSLPQVSSEKSDLTSRRKKTVKIVHISGMTEIKDGYYLCISMNTSKTPADECTYNNLKFSVFKKSTSQLLNVEDCHTSQGIVNTAYYVAFTGIENIEDGRYFIIHLEEKKQGGESAVTNVDEVQSHVETNENNSQSSLPFIENLVHNNEDNFQESPTSVDVNYHNFITLFESINAPNGSTVQDVKAHLAHHNFYISSKRLKKFLGKGMRRQKIIKLNNTYHLIYPIAHL